MGNGYNHHHHHHHQTLHNLHQKTTFLSLLCSRSSIKDVAVVPRWEDRSFSSSSSSSNDPLSPKIGCMGQVKQNQKFNVGFHTSRKIMVSTKNNSSSSVKYFKLNKIFSFKNNYIANTSSTTTAAAKIVDGKENSGFVNIVEMDPPLPVIRKVKVRTDGGGEGEGVESLWKRRSGGIALKSLRIQEIQINRHGIIEPTTV